MALLSRGILSENRVIPGLIIGFFVALTALEICLIVLSVRSFTGLSEADPYRRGLRYNEVIDARARDMALGWRTEIAFRSTGAFQGEAIISVRDQNGAPLEGAVITASVHRVTGKPKVQAISIEALGAGRAVGRFGVGEPGRWFIKARIQAGEDVVERFREVMVEGK